MFCLTAKLPKKSLQDQSSYRLEKTGLTYFDQEGEKVLGFPVDQFEDIGRRRPRNQGIRQVLRVSGSKTNIREVDGDRRGRRSQNVLGRNHGVSSIDVPPKPSDSSVSRFELMRQDEIIDHTRIIQFILRLQIAPANGRKGLGNGIVGNTLRISKHVGSLSVT